MTDPVARRLLIAGGLLAGLAVAFGAFGAHALRGTLDPERLGWWHSGAEYQLWHGLALVALAGSPLHRKGIAGLLLGIGAALFAASLYGLALTGWRWLGILTPIGGTAMIAGWAVVVCCAFLCRTEE